MEKRELRVSGYKDYIAIDIVKDNKVLSTPFYLKKGEVKEVLYKDQEEKQVYRTKVQMSEDFTKLKCSDKDGMNWESELDELLDATIINFIQ